MLNTKAKTIQAPLSKSYLHRAILASFLSRKEEPIYFKSPCEDVLKTLDAVKKLGAKVERKKDYITIKRGALPKSATINCGESGTTFRFLLAICSALKVKATFVLDKGLLVRPIKPLIDALNTNGADITKDGNKYIIFGSIDSGDFFIDGSISSQFVSGLMFALSYLGNSRLVITGKSVSKNYIRLTEQVLKDFGGIFKKGLKKYYLYGFDRTTPAKVRIEGDYSGASILLCAGAIKNGISISGLNKKSFQADRKIINILKRFGVETEIDGDIIKTKSGNLKGVKVDIDNCIDLISCVALLGAFASGKTVICGVNRLKNKESDRIDGVLLALKGASVNCWYENGKIIVVGGKVEKLAFSNSFDHRIVMLEIALKYLTNSNIEIKNIEAVNKSYPDYLRDIKLTLGVDE